MAIQCYTDLSTLRWLILFAVELDGIRMGYDHIVCHASIALSVDSERLEHSSHPRFGIALVPRREDAFLVTKAGDDPRLIEGDPTSVLYVNPDFREKARQIPVLDEIPIRIEAQLTMPDIDRISSGFHFTHLSVVDEVLHNLLFVKPATISVVHSLR